MNWHVETERKKKINLLHTHIQENCSIYPIIYFFLLISLFIFQTSGLTDTGRHSAARIQKKTVKRRTDTQIERGTEKIYIHNIISSKTENTEEFQAIRYKILRNLSDGATQNTRM